jgi:hypothetical protein
MPGISELHFVGLMIIKDVVEALSFSASSNVRTASTCCATIALEAAIKGIPVAEAPLASA